MTISKNANERLRKLCIEAGRPDGTPVDYLLELRYRTLNNFNSLEPNGIIAQIRAACAEKSPSRSR